MRCPRYLVVGFEEFASLLPDLTWYQVFREVDRLSRTGQLRLMLDGRGIFTGQDRRNTGAAGVTLLIRSTMSPSPTFQYVYLWE